MRSEDRISNATAPICIPHPHSQNPSYSRLTPISQLDPSLPILGGWLPPNDSVYPSQVLLHTVSQAQSCPKRLPSCIRGRQSHAYRSTSQRVYIDAAVISPTIQNPGLFRTILRRQAYSIQVRISFKVQVEVKACRASRIDHSVGICAMQFAYGQLEEHKCTRNATYARKPLLCQTAC